MPGAFSSAFSTAFDVLRRNAALYLATASVFRPGYVEAIVFKDGSKAQDIISPGAMNTTVFLPGEIKDVYSPTSEGKS